MQIRIATTADVAALAALNKEYNEVDATPEQMAAQIEAARGHETALIADDGGEMAGFACLRLVRCVCYAEPHAEVTELYVRPAHRRKGVGTALMRHAERLAQEAGAPVLFLDTGFYNHDAQALYRSLGYSIDALKMRKPLTPTLSQRRESYKQLANTLCTRWVSTPFKSASIRLVIRAKHTP